MYGHGRMSFSRTWGFLSSSRLIRSYSRPAIYRFVDHSTTPLTIRTRITRTSCYGNESGSKPPASNWACLLDSELGLRTHCDGAIGHRHGTSSDHSLSASSF